MLYVISTSPAANGALLAIDARAGTLADARTLVHPLAAAGRCRFTSKELLSPILIGAGDLLQAPGYPRPCDRPAVVDAMRRIVATSRKHEVVVGNRTPACTTSNGCLAKAIAS